MKVSIIIPTFNEEKYIEDNILGMLEADFDMNELEIIYVDGMSSDNTRKIISEYEQKYDNISLIDNPQRFTPFAVNIGVKNARGTYIIIVGSHSRLHRDYIKVLVETIEETGAEAGGGVLVTHIVNQNVKSVAIMKVLTNKFGVGNASYRVCENDDSIREVDTAGFLCYQRQKFIDIGMYNEKLIRNHDIELNRRIKNNGGKILLVPSAVGTYYARETYSSLGKNNYQNGKWNILTVYYTKTIKSLSLRHFIPLIFILSLIVPLLGTMFFKPFIWISLFSFVAYNALIFFQSLKMNEPQTDLWHLIKAFYTIHFSYGVGSLIGLFKTLKLKLFGDK